MLETDILIVGGGPAGATVAKYLSLANIPNILIQKKFNFKKPCGGGIRVDAFEEFNLDKKIINKYIEKIVLAFKDKRVHVDITQTPLAIVERRAFDSYLREEAKQAGTELYEAKLLEVKIEDDYVLSAINFGGEIKTVKSRYLIAADGVNSSIRKHLSGERVSALLTNYADIEDNSLQDCEFHFGADIADKYYAWAFPESGGTNIGTLADGTKPYMQNFMNSIDVKEAIRVNGYKIPEFNKPLFYKERVFFVGDSAEQVLPFTYEGIYYAMSSAKILAETLIDKADPLEYEQRWKHKHLKKFKTLQRLQKIFLHNDFMIGIMMRLYKNSSVQKRMMELWLTNKEINIDFKFFLKVLKRVY